MSNELGCAKSENGLDVTNINCGKMWPDWIDPTDLTNSVKCWVDELASVTTIQRIGRWIDQMDRQMDLTVLVLSWGINSMAESIRDDWRWGPTSTMTDFWLLRWNEMEDDSQTAFTSVVIDCWILSVDDSKRDGRDINLFECSITTMNRWITCKEWRMIRYRWRSENVDVKCYNATRPTVHHCTIRYQVIVTLV